MAGPYDLSATIVIVCMRHSEPSHTGPDPKRLLLTAWNAATLTIAAFVEENVVEPGCTFVHTYCSSSDWTVFLKVHLEIIPVGHEVERVPHFDSDADAPSPLRSIVRQAPNNFTIHLISKGLDGVSISPGDRSTLMSSGRATGGHTMHLTYDIQSDCSDSLLLGDFGRDFTSINDEYVPSVIYAQKKLSAQRHQYRRADTFTRERNQ